MYLQRSGFFHASAWIAVALVASFVLTQPAEARVRKIVIERKVSPAFDGASFGLAGQYETLAGRAFGELDPNDPHNTIITDIKLAPRNANGKVEYVASFYLVKPIDLSKASRLMWQDVPNRGGRITISPLQRNDGDIGLSSGWQGDSSGRTVPADDNDWVMVPIAKNPDGSPVSGLVLGRIVNASGPDSRPMIVNANPVPYKPATLDTTKATLTTHISESMDGKIIEGPAVPSSDWAWAKCSAANPFPGTPDPTQICLKNGFDPKLLYQVVFTSNDAYVLGIGFAAFRDVASFFRYATKDDDGTPNPVAGNVSWAINRGQSQSGNFLRALIHLGFTQDEANRKVYDGSWPIIAGKRVTLNTRFALPDGAGKLYEAGPEGPQWWSDWPDPVRGLPTKGILDRCTHEQFVPEDRRALRRGRDVGVDAESLICRNVGGQGHSVAEQRAALLHSKYSARRRPRRLQRQPAGGANVSRSELRRGNLPRESSSPHGDGQRAPVSLPQLGDERHADARERVPDVGKSQPRGSDERGCWVPQHSWCAWQCSDRHDEPGARLRLGPRLQLCRWLRRANESPAAGQAGDQDEGSTCGRRWQRDGWSSRRPPRRAPRLLSGLECRG